MERKLIEYLTEISELCPKLDSIEDAINLAKEVLVEYDVTVSRLKDAEIAVEKHDWRWVNRDGIDSVREFLLPPEGDHREYWCAMWDENGIPHYLPEYSKDVSN